MASSQERWGGKGTHEERGRGTGKSLDSWVEHFLADQENEDLTGLVPVPSWALFSYRSRRAIEDSESGKEVSEVGGHMSLSRC